MKRVVFILGVVLGLMLGFSVLHAEDITDVDRASAFNVQETLLIEQLERRTIEADKTIFENLSKPMIIK